MSLGHRMGMAGVACVAAGLLGAASPQARGVAVDWNNPAGGDANVSSNWLPSVLPGAADDLDFDLNNTYTVNWLDTINNVNSLDVLRGDVTFFANSSGNDVTTAGNLVVADGTGGAAALTLDSRGTWNVGNSALVGFNPGEVGELDVDLLVGTVNIAANLDVGTRGVGTFRLHDGRVNVAGDLNAASSNSGSAGTALIELTGSNVTDELTVTGATVLGSAVFPAGIATMNVNGGEFNAQGGLTIHSGSSLTLNGGDVVALAGLDNSHGGTLDHRDGTLSVRGGAFLPNNNAPGSDLIVDGSTPTDLPLLSLSSGGTANIDDAVIVGQNNQGQVNLSGSAVLDSNTAFIAASAGSTGTVNLFSNATWNLSGGFVVGDRGTGTLNVENTTQLISTAGTSTIGDDSGAVGVANVNGGMLQAVTLEVGDSADGTLNVSGGGTATVTGLFRVGDSSGGVGVTAVEGAGSSLTVTGSSDIGRIGAGTMHIRDGGVVNLTGSVDVGSSGGSTGTVTIEGTDSTWTVGGILDVARFDGTSTGSVTVSDRGRLDAQNQIRVYAGGTLTLNDGALEAQSLTVSGGTFNFLSGSLTVDAGLTIGDDPAGVLPNDVVLTADKSLSTAGTTSISPGRELRIDGGTLTTGALIKNGDFVFDAGTLNVTGAGGFTFGAAGPMGAIVSLGPDQAINVTNTAALGSDAVVVLEAGAALNADTTANNGELVLNGLLARIEGTTVNNAGLLRGDGRVTAALNNQAVGEVRVGAGHTLRFMGAATTNAGRLNLQGGTAEFDNAVTNQAGGDIVGRGTLLVGGAGLSNAGDLALSNGQTDVFGDVDNHTTGRVMVSGHADATFWDDVTHTGTLFNVSAGSSVTFFGGAGFGVSGGGDVFFEADITPGSSPGLETFGGNVHFGPLADLEIELEGTLRGAGYDALDVAGVANLGGTLDVSLLGGFTPTAGDTFTILDAAGGITGTFNNEALPALKGGLSLNVVYNPMSVVLEVLSAGIAGDYNASGQVEQGDLDLVLQNWGRDTVVSGIPTGWTNDLPDGLIDQAELDGVLLNWGATAAPSFGGASVPEPGVSATVGLALALLRCRKSRA